MRKKNPNVNTQFMLSLSIMMTFSICDGRQLMIGKNLSWKCGKLYSIEKAFQVRIYQNFAILMNFNKVFWIFNNFPTINWLSSHHVSSKHHPLHDTITTLEFPLACYLNSLFKSLKRKKMTAQDEEKNFLVKPILTF